MDSIILALIVGLSTVVISAWMAGALYFDVAQAKPIGWLLMAAWFALVLAAFFIIPQRSLAFLAVLVAFALFLRWWLTLKPSQDRNWDPNFSQLAQIELLGDALTVKNVRNTEYRTLKDCDTRYETRSYLLSRMQGVDVLVLYWGSKSMSHPMFVFDFGDEGRLCISIEVRYRVGQLYNFWRSLYRQQELIYIVSDERDAILRRTKAMTGNDLYLYRIFGSPLEMRQFFLEYAHRINQLVENPRWYHGVTANCTTGIYTQGRGRIRWDIRMLFNGRLDELFYDRGRLDRTIPWQDLKSKSRVNDLANRAPREGFGDFIRRELPGYRGQAATTETDAKISS
jgi:hypothetical protein